MNSLMDSSGGATLRGLYNMSNKRALPLPNNIHVIPAFIFFFLIAKIVHFLIGLINRAQCFKCHSFADVNGDFYLDHHFFTITDGKAVFLLFRNERWKNHDPHPVGL